MAKVDKPGKRKNSPLRKKIKQRVGLALGSGSARGWAHIGVIKALDDLGIQAQMISGSSIGALVGAAYVSGNLNALNEWALSLRRVNFLRFIDLRLTGGGLVEGHRLMDFLRQYIRNVPIETLSRPFAAVGTDLITGREVWFRDGSLLDAVRASIAIPGIFTPVMKDNHWLLDGGLVNPVPITLCRALGAQVVIAVNPYGDRLGWVNNRETGAYGIGHFPEGEEDEEERENLPWGKRAQELISRILGRGQKVPGLLEVLTGSLNIMQDRITRSTMAGDPPDVLLAPRLAHIGLLEFNRAEEAIAEGEACVHRMLPALEDALGI